jgi:hypothetical protein
MENPAKAKTVTVAEGQEGAAGAVFDLAPNLGLVSDERAANGGVIAGVKKGEDTQPDSSGRGARRNRRQSFLVAFGVAHEGGSNEGKRVSNTWKEARFASSAARYFYLNCSALDAMLISKTR